MASPSRTDLAFHALGDEVRRSIMDLLRAGERSAGEIAAAFPITWPAVSRHLRLLREAGLVVERREGRRRFYRLDRGEFGATVGDWVAAFDARWARNLRSLKDQLESQHPTRGTP